MSRSLGDVIGEATRRLRSSRRLRQSFVFWIIFGLISGEAGTLFATLASAKSFVPYAVINLVFWAFACSVLFGMTSLLITPDGNEVDHLGVPNALSLLRVWVCMPMLYLAVFGLPHDQGFVWWLVIGAPVGYVDIVDGFVARRWGPVTQLGKALDPAVDALYFAFAAVGAVALQVMSPWIAGLTLVRYLGPLLATPFVLLAGKRPELVHTQWGRLNTLLTGWVAVACCVVRATGHDAVTTSLIVGLPLLVPTTFLHFVSLWRRVGGSD